MEDKLDQVLAEAKGKLAVAEGKLAEAKGKLAVAEGKLGVAKAELAVAKVELAVAEGKLAKAQVPDEKERAQQDVDTARMGVKSAQEYVSAMTRAAIAALPADQQSAGIPFSVRPIKSKGYTIIHASSLPELEQKVIGTFTADQLDVFDFAIMKHKKAADPTEVISTTEELMGLSKNTKLVVVKLSKSFSKVTLEDAKEQLGIPRSAAIPHTQSEFPEPVSFDTNELKKIVKQVVKEIVRREPHFPNLSSCPESTQREFIGPVMVGAVRLLLQKNKDLVTLVTEHPVRGSLSKGQLDYGFLSQQYLVLIAEAKRYDVGVALPQNLAQIAAAREQYLRETATVSPEPKGKKRKHYEIAEIREIPAFGVLTNGRVYRFVSYKLHAGHPAVFQSDDMTISLGGKKSVVDLLPEIARVLAQLVAILELQVQQLGVKRPRLG